MRGQTGPVTEISDFSFCNWDLSNWGENFPIWSLQPSEFVPVDHAEISHKNTPQNLFPGYWA